MQLQHLVLGFELELYAPEEFCMMYWCASWPHMRREFLKVAASLKDRMLRVESLFLVVKGCNTHEMPQKRLQ